jgi:uncharacterized protein (DUF1800 family)
MRSRKSRLWLQILGASLATFLLIFSVSAQEDDPNPDSPTPVLLSETGSTRALAVASESVGRTNLSKTKSAAFSANSKILLFVTNIDLMPDEGANAFRVNVEDTKGRRYRFPVLDISPVKEQPGVYALTVQLKDELGFWERPKFKGDVLLTLTWRGLASNSLRLGIGKTGGNLRDKIGAGSTSAMPTQTDKSENTVNPNYIGYYYSADRMRFLEQATFGPTFSLDQKIRRLGLRNWLNTQFDAPYPTYPYPNLELKSTDTGTGCPAGSPSTCGRDYYTQYLVQNWFFKEAFYGDAQLRHRTAWALSQLWVVSGVDTQQASWMVAYHQKLSQHAFGNYRNLMTDITLNPAMGNYLDMIRSTRTNPNENFAREILQLFSVGLFMLNQDGTLQLDGNGEPIPTYDQNTVNNFTKVFTGFTLCETTALCPSRTVGAPNYKDPLLLNQNTHDLTAKTLLAYPNAVSQNLPANQNGVTDMTQALDNIFNHPNVAPFVSRNLIQHLVTSDPTPAYVGRVAAAFNNNGSGVRGDMKAVIRAILLDPEARGNVKTDPNYGKLREPVQLATNLYRQFNVRSFDGTTQSDGYVNPTISPMGQNTFLSPTVFNYYTPDYTVPGTALNGPEFGIMTTGTAIARANFVNNIAFNRIATSANSLTGTSIDLAEMQALATADTSSNQLLDALNTKLLHGTMSAQMKNTILTAVQAVASTDPLNRARTAIYLVASSSQYQVQR